MPGGGKQPGAGRPRGSKNERTKQWESLHARIVGIETERFGQAMDELFEKDKKGYLDAYLRILQYFRPQLQRAEVKTEAVHRVYEVVDARPEQLKKVG